MMAISAFNELIELQNISKNKFHESLWIRKPNTDLTIF